MPARTQEYEISIGYKKQAALQTALSAGSLWKLGLNAFNAPFPAFNQEDDSEFFGKGHEWVTQVFPTSIDLPWEWPFHLTSQNWCQAIVFGLGNVTQSNPAGSAYQYVCTPMDPVTDGVNLPATTVVAGIRAGGAGEILDIANIGMICNGFTLRLQRGPGLQNSQLTSQWIGCGKYTNDSGIATPDSHVEHRLGAGSTVTLTIGGVDYIANARFVDLEFSYQNNAGGDSGYYPGSGSQDGFDIRGRMRYGRRTASLVWQVELESDSAELDALLAGTEGTATITIEGSIISGATKHTAKIELPRTRHKAYQLADADGFVAARIETSIMYDATDGPMILTGITDKADIGVEE
jgi:hypothetical protein